MAGLNTNAVAGRAGVSIGTLYQYFGNKDAVFAELQARYAESLVEKMAEDSDDDQTEWSPKKHSLNPYEDSLPREKIEYCALKFPKGMLDLLIQRDSEGFLEFMAGD